MKNRPYIFLIIISVLLLFKGEVFAQNQKQIDSLKQIITLAKQDTNKVITLLELGDQYEYNKPDSALVCYHRALDISKEIKSQTLIAKCSRYIGIIYYYQGFYTKAIAYHIKSLNTYKKIGDKKGISGSYNNIGLVYEYQGAYTKAISYYLKSLKISEEIGDKKVIQSAYNNIGGIHYNQGSFDEALSYFFKSLKISKEIGIKKGVADSYNNIGSIYQQQGFEDKSLQYHLKSLKIKEEIGDKRGLFSSYQNLGLSYYTKGSYDKTLSYYLKSLNIAEEMDDKHGIATTYLNISALNIRLADSTAINETQRIEYLKKAIKNSSWSYKLAKEIGSLPLVSEACNSLMNTYSKLGNYKRAIEFSEIYIISKDSLFDKTKTKELAKIEAKYEYQKQAEIDSLAHVNEIKIKDQVLLIEKEVSKMKIITFVIIGSIILIVTLLIIYLQRGRIKKNKMISQQEKELTNVNLKNKELENKNLLSELEYKHKEVVNFAIHIAEKNDFLENLQKTLNASNDQIDPKTIKKLIAQNLSTEKDREEFNANIESLNDSFFLTLGEKFPKLTKTDKRLCALLRLNLSSKEIASIQNISPNSVDVNRYRLRKKLDITTDEDLSNFLNAFI
jgi:tetratricopeptide (TPR) repeat protein/DNA-binding CsgD family transcriptional regulator